MRPQPIGCGNAAMPAVRHKRRYTASMRPQPIGCGNISILFALGEAYYASMRPQPIGVVASMRPQPIGCGNSPTAILFNFQGSCPHFASGPVPGPSNSSPLLRSTLQVQAYTKFA